MDIIGGNLIIAVGQLIDMALGLYLWMIIISALLSWVNPDPYNPIVRFLRSATEPVLWRIRRVVPIMGGLDLSPLIAAVAIVFLRRLVASSLIIYGQRLIR